MSIESTYILGAIAIGLGATLAGSRHYKRGVAEERRQGPSPHDKAVFSAEKNSVIPAAAQREAVRC